MTVLGPYGNISTAVEVVWLKPHQPIGHITGQEKGGDDAEDYADDVCVAWGEEEKEEL